MKCLCVAIVLLLSGIANSQSIEGTVYHNDETVPFANILICKPSSPSLIDQYTSANDYGYYKIELDVISDSVWVEVSSMSFESQRLKIKTPKKGDVIKQDFTLKIRQTELKEVIIEKTQAITQKKDTVTYNPDSFRDGSERVVEDLLKKLPGIKIEPSGEIKYKGKSIKKLLLDGDDLFNSQYTVGSKNINVDIIDKVQAVEHYNENSLLKGLVNANDVALNLQLKKGKADISGDASLGYGFENRYNIRVTGLLVSKNSKGFLTSAYNNIGENYSPYDFKSSILSVESLNEKEFEAKELIQQGNFYSQIHDKYVRINSNFYSNINFLHKFSNKTTAKISLGIYDDRLARKNESNTRYTAQNENFEIKQIESLKKKPRLYNGSIQFSQKLQDSLSWEYLGKINYSKISFDSGSLNNDIVQNNTVSTQNFYTKQNINITKRIDANSAINTSGLFSISRAPQTFALNPGLNVTNYDESIIENNQQSRFDKQILSIQSEYYLNINNYKFRVLGAYKRVRNKFKSQLTSYQTDEFAYTNEDYTNDMHYSYELPYITTSVNRLFKQKYGFSLGISAQYYDLWLDDKIRNNYVNENSLVLSPAINILYIINKKANLTAAYSYNQIAPEENFLFSGVVLTSYRDFRNNEPNFKFLKTHAYSLNYMYNDFFKLTSYSVMLTHNRRENNYFYRSIISAENTITTSFLANVGNKDYNLVLNGEKYLRFIKSTAQLTAGYTMSFDKNVVNDSNLRDIEVDYYYLNFILRRSLNSFIEVENKIEYSSTTFALDGITQNRNNNLMDTFKILAKKNRFRATALLNFIAPDLSQNNNYYFFDAEIRYTTKSKKIDYSLSGRNLTNNKKFETVNVSDYSRTVSSHNLLNRYVMFSIDFHF